MFQRGSFARQRRALIACTAAGLAAPAVLAQAARGPTRPISVAQLFDASPAQQDVSKDFLIGSRAAWQDINARGGLRGRPVTHLNVEVDGTPAGVRTALAGLRDQADCVALTGTAGAAAAAEVVRQLRQDALPLAHAAPWLQDAAGEVDDRTFPIFAARQEQIAHALRSLTSVGVREVGAVYATPAEFRLYREDLERAAAGLQLKLQTYRADGDLDRMGERLAPGTPAVLLFVGGTPELVQFTQGLQRQQRQRYVVALADVNLQTMMQMGGGRGIPVIATQAVPMVTSSLPIVRAYRETMARLFDEPPAALSLAGFIAARYTFEVLAGIEGPVTRQSALAAFRRRHGVDLGGFRVSFDERGRAGSYVTQSMLTQDGRVVG